MCLCVIAIMIASPHWVQGLASSNLSPDQATWEHFCHGKFLGRKAQRTRPLPRTPARGRGLLLTPRNYLYSPHSPLTQHGICAKMTAAAQKHQDDQKPTLKSHPGPSNPPLAWTLSTKPWELPSRPSEGFSWEKDRIGPVRIT